MNSSRASAVDEHLTAKDHSCGSAIARHCRGRTYADTSVNVAYRTQSYHIKRRASGPGSAVILTAATRRNDFPPTDNVCRLLVIGAQACRLLATSPLRPSRCFGAARSEEPGCHSSWTELRNDSRGHRGSVSIAKSFPLHHSTFQTTSVNFATYFPGLMNGCEAVQISQESQNQQQHHGAPADQHQQPLSISHEVPTRRRQSFTSSHYRPC